jgi:hypothetical protein
VTFFRLLFRWLGSSPVGLLALSATLYVAVDGLTSVEPYAFGQLLLWFDELSETFKGAVGGSLLTVIGFLIAFQSGQVQSRKSRLMERQLVVADALTDFFEDVNATLGTLCTRTGILVELLDESVMDKGQSPELTPTIIDAMNASKAASDHLHDLAGRSIGLRSEYDYITDLHFAVPWALTRYSRNLVKISTSRSHTFATDDVVKDEFANELFWRYFDDRTAREFLACCDALQRKLIGHQIMIESSLYADIAPDNAATWLNDLESKASRTVAATKEKAKENEDESNK